MQIFDLIINGRKKQIAAEPDWNLLYVLREVLDLTGTKCGCGTGNCGSCKVIVDGRAVNACCLKVSALSGKQITTIEGLSDGVHLHPIQQAFIDAGAVQCGFCTPGMVMCAKALLDKIPHPTDAEIKKALRGNLCRCTGYVKIVEAVKLAAERLSAGEAVEAGTASCGNEGESAALNRAASEGSAAAASCAADSTRTAAAAAAQGAKAAEEGQEEACV